MIKIKLVNKIALIENHKRYFGRRLKVVNDDWVVNHCRGYTIEYGLAIPPAKRNEEPISIVRHNIEGRSFRMVSDKAKDFSGDIAIDPPIKEK